MEQEHTTKHNSGYNIEKVRLPSASVGECANSKHCRNFVTDLANGYCVKCWDRGIDQRRRNNLDKPVLKRRKQNGQFNSRNYSNRLSWGNGRY